MIHNFYLQQFVVVVAAVVGMTWARPDHAPHHPGYHAPLPPPVHHAPVHHAPVHHAPVHHAPVHHASVHHAPVYKETPHPYNYKYGVHDDYSGANFEAGESSDGHGNVEGSYSVLLPDGRVQHVKYHADHHAGYVADVTYEGAAHHPSHLPHPHQ